MSFIPILKNHPNPDEYKKVDLSEVTLSKNKVTASQHDSLRHYLENVKVKINAKVLYGGYIEKRTLYNTKELFQDKQRQRNIHIGLDFWANAGEEIIAPLDGIIHSFADNEGFGNYGPCIILKHKVSGEDLFSLYGHLSRESLLNIKVGQMVVKQQVFCKLGTPEENGGYVPHLHFQLIRNIGNYKGDYPGVCHEENLGYYKSNTINPEIFLDL